MVRCGVVRCGVVRNWLVDGCSYDRPVFDEFADKLDDGRKDDPEGDVEALARGTDGEL